jgi:hypothetical protein
MTSPSYACRNTAFDMPDLTDQSPSYVLTHPLSLSVHLCTVYVGGCARADTPRITYTFEGLEDLRDWRAESRRKERKHERKNCSSLQSLARSYMVLRDLRAESRRKEGTNELLISCLLLAHMVGFEGFGGRGVSRGKERKNWLISCLLLAHVVFHVFQNFRYFKVVQSLRRRNRCCV